MKLKNKKTGEIGNLNAAWLLDTLTVETPEADMPNKIVHYTSLAELNEEWEDVTEEPKEHWAIDQFGEPINVTGLSRLQLEKLRQCGNDFETEEEADKAVEKLKAWKRLKDKGFRFEGWTIDDGLKISICTNFDDDNIYSNSEKEIKNDLDLVFGGEE